LELQTLVVAVEVEQIQLHPDLLVLMPEKMVDQEL
jgi:hypothetical protein|tara:strand:- start:26 stop:130 length:105 start_codon:yes stop_codon:yes gene_type:complete